MKAIVKVAFHDVYENKTKHVGEELELTKKRFEELADHVELKNAPVTEKKIIKSSREKREIKKPGG
jgi:DUF438 domain-containing protein